MRCKVIAQPPQSLCSTDPPAAFRNSKLNMFPCCHLELRMRQRDRHLPLWGPADQESPRPTNGSTFLIL